MIVYIDESGNFSGVGQSNSPSIVGALVVPDHKHEFLLRQYRKLRRSLPKDDDQIKGRLLDEAQVRQVTFLLRQAEALFFTAFIEMGLHTTASLEQHRAGTAKGMVSNLTDAHNPAVRTAVYQLKSRLEQLPLQLYVQGLVLNQLLARVLAEATAYFAQRHPAELGRFEWVLDAKGDSNRLTEWEDWWRSTFMPFLQSQSLQQPAWKLEGADYSHFNRFEMNVPRHLSSHIPRTSISTKVIDLKQVFTENLRISNHSEPGLELVDVVTNSLRRAFKATLRQEGWLSLRSIMIHRRHQYIDVLDFGGHQKSSLYPTDYRMVFNAFRTGGRTMLVPDTLRPAKAT